MDLGTIDIDKTQTGAATNTMSFSFTLSGDCNGAKKVDLYEMHFGYDDGAPFSTSPFSAFGVLMVQTSKSRSFMASVNGDGAKLEWDKGLTIDAKDGDTVTITVNLASATNANTRRCYIRAGLRAI